MIKAKNTVPIIEYIGCRLLMRMNSENDELVGRDADGNFIYLPCYEDITDDLLKIIIQQINSLESVYLKDANSNESDSEFVRKEDVLSLFINKGA